jgi:hypothetical protein
MIVAGWRGKSNRRHASSRFIFFGADLLSLTQPSTLQQGARPSADYSDRHGALCIAAVLVDRDALVNQRRSLGRQLNVDRNAGGWASLG